MELLSLAVVVQFVLVLVMLAALAAAIWFASLAVIDLVAVFRSPAKQRPRYVLDLSGRAPWLSR